MCGISGLVWKDLDRPGGLAQVARMDTAQFHRGPDGGGTFADGPVALGHRRLSIIDLSERSDQPMISADRRFVLVFNGEIYNYKELRAELEARGVLFHSQGDTEVLLQAYATWGTDCVSRFNGMWAFAILDREQRGIFLSRDRFGIKPLYFANRPECFGFASEMKALLAAVPELRRPNHAFLARFLVSGALDDSTATVFEGVEQLPPAHNAWYDMRKGHLRCWRYWDIRPDSIHGDWHGRDPALELRELLESAIRLHMRSDVPVGTCLSGGLDSSTIVCWMSALRERPVYTYSGLYPDRDCDEQEFVHAVRRHSGCIGVDIRREPDGDLLDHMATVTWHQDMPTAGPSLYTQFNVMQRASQDVKVILDGQGGDELFAGYLPYYRLRIRDLLAQRSPAALLEALRLAGTVGLHWGPRWLKPSSGWRAAARRAAARIPGLPTGDPPMLDPGLARLAEQPPAPEHPGYGDRLSRALYLDTVSRSIPALLHYEDRNSMAWSVEARVPLLDHRIVEFALGLPAEFKIRNGWTKWVLRKAAEPRLPAQVAWRRSKLGYPTPAARWMRQPRDRDALHDLLFSGDFLHRGIATREGLEHHWRQHQRGAADRSWLLHRYATTELWFRHFIDRFEPRTARPVPRHEEADRTLSSLPGPVPAPSA